MEFDRCRKIVKIRLQNFTTFILRGPRCVLTSRLALSACMSHTASSNMYLIVPSILQGDADGYDLVVVDAMHKANYASRICHSCRPNCEAK